MQATTVNRESQKMLAKLLAKENINVRVGNYSTAFFDVKNRVLGLPMWNAENKQVSDLLVGHEVGHALYTPADAQARFHEALPDAPFDIANIVEDVRIERLIQNNYPGLVYSFKEGYRHFIEKDFFKIKDTDISKLGFADRLNIHAKIGGQLHVPLSAIEEAVYARCLAAETFDEVLDICKTIYEMVKSEKPKKQSKASKPADENSPTNPRNKESKKKSDDAGQGENGSDGIQSDSANDESQSDSKKDEAKNQRKHKDDQAAESADKQDKNNDGADTEDGGTNESTPEYGDANDELTSQTMKSLGEQLNDMQEAVTDYLVGNAPDPDEMMSHVIPVEEIMAERHLSSVYAQIMALPSVQEDWKTFKAATKKHISVLVKEFERRKAAFQYSRAQQSTTGTIDVNRLHAYKFEDQIFRSVTQLADAKNHGMVFFIDYSGSMHGTIGRVIVQTLQLVYFCKAVGIPFEVYGFTSPVSHSRENDKPPLKFGSNLAFRYTHIFELVNSSMKRDKFELACRELKAQAFLRADNNGGSGSMAFSNQRYEVMNGTPLNETIVIAHEIVKRFKARHRVQKMNTVFLTDGDACPCFFDTNEDDAAHRKLSHIPDWKCGHLIPINGRNIMFRTHDKSSLYSALIENLRITCGTTVIGFFVANYRSDYKSTAISALRYAEKTAEGILPWPAANELFQKKSREARKEKCMMILGGFNYDAYFVFDSKNGLDINDDGEEFSSNVVSESFSDVSSQNRLAKEFTKFTSEKKLSRVFLNKFAEIIA